MSRISFSARSDRGCVRANNEDNLYCAGTMLLAESREIPFSLSDELSPPCVFAVFDGLGGQAEGERASLLAAQTLQGCEADILQADRKTVDDEIQAYVERINNLLCKEMCERSVRMGTTMVLVVVRDNVVYPYTIGDSRVYALLDGRLRQLSKDHTYATQKIEMGLITEQEARKSSDWHKLTICLGVFEDEVTVQADELKPVNIADYGRFLLCSDGLTDMLEDLRIEEILRRAPTADEATGQLLAAAVECGCRDNITCIVLDILPLDSSPKKFKKFLSGGRSQ